ncbi:MAG: CRISPR-associated protein Csx16 [Xanthomonadales bacterium]|nr:CRISPR-associated protein Csx16 [Xanthomonadales bacterium]
MTAYFVSRHPATIEWARQQEPHVDYQIMHLNSDVLRPGDEVFDTLPVNLAGSVTARGAQCFHLSLNMPSSARGEELSARGMLIYSTHLEGFRVLGSSYGLAQPTQQPAGSQQSTR